MGNKIKFEFLKIKSRLYKSRALKFQKIPVISSHEHTTQRERIPPTNSLRSFPLFREYGENACKYLTLSMYKQRYIKETVKRLKKIIGPQLIMVNIDKQIGICGPFNNVYFTDHRLEALRAQQP